MSICSSGLSSPGQLQPVTIAVAPAHPLIQLAQVIPWKALPHLVLPDLQHPTAKGKWWIGRKLQLRIHLGAFLLQWLYNLTDRRVEWEIKDNAAYQLFCGWGMVDQWHCPDHTKIEEFRSRLAPETQRQVTNAIVCWATQLGFADPAKMDLDSTVQEANITYPSDAHLMVKLTLLAGKVWTYLKENLSYFADFTPTVDVKAVSCFNKGKLAKGLQFGRAFQLGRIEGNFLLAGWCSSIRMEDKTSLRPMIVEHQHLFGKGILKSLGTDKGYYSEANRGYLRGLEGLEEFCIPQPGLDPEHQSPDATAIQARLLDRRSGIEPLIGHAKQGGQLGKSRMKKDESTLAAGYASIGGFNLRQLVRHLLGKDIKAMA